ALPFVATFTLAALIGVAFRRLESGAPATRLVALGAAALLIVFVWDLRSYPEESLLPFVLNDASFPESFTESAKHWLEYGSLPCLVVLALALGDLPRATQARPFASFGEYTRWLSALAARGRGRLLAALAAVTLLLGVLPVLRFLA